MHVSDSDASVSVDSGNRRMPAGVFFPLPWYGAPPPSKPAKSEECGPDCWYMSQGFSQCYDHADGVCILAMRGR